MGKDSGSSSAPAAPDPKATAAAQYGLNHQTMMDLANMNRVNQVTPWGTTSWTQSGGSAPSKTWVADSPGGDIGGHYETIDTPDGGSAQKWVAGGGASSGHYEENPGSDGTWTQSVSLSPDQQKLYDLGSQLKTGSSEMALGMMPAVRSAISRGYDFSGLPSLSGVGGPQRSLDLSGLPELKSDLGLLTDLGLQSDLGLQTDVAGGDANIDNATRVQQALIDRLSPSLKQQQDALETKLANQGITYGSEAWKNAQDDISRQNNDLRLAAVQAGTQEQQRLFNDALQGGQFRNSALEAGGAFKNNALLQGGQFRNAALTEGGAFANAARQMALEERLSAGNFANSAQDQAYRQALQGRQQSIGEQQLEHNQPLQDFAALTGAGGSVSMPQFPSFVPASMQAPDITTPTYQSYQGQVAAANQEKSSNNAKMGGMGSMAGMLGSAAIMA